MEKKYVIKIGQPNRGWIFLAEKNIEGKWEMIDETTNEVYDMEGYHHYKEITEAEYKEVLDLLIEDPSSIEVEESIKKLLEQ